MVENAKIKIQMRHFGQFSNNVTWGNMIFYVLKIADFSYCAIPRACNCEKKPSICTKIKIMAKLDGGGDYGENMEMSLARNIHPGDR